MTPTSPSWTTSSYEKHSNKPSGLPALMLKPMGMVERSHSIPLPSNHVHRTESEVQLQAGLEAAERRNLRMFYRLVNGVRTQQHSPLPAPTESCEPWASASADADIMKLHHQRDGPNDGAGSLPCFDDEDVTVEGQRSASAPPPFIADDDWSISGFSEHQPKELEQPEASATDDDFGEDGVFDIDL